MVRRGDKRSGFKGSAKLPSEDNGLASSHKFFPQTTGNKHTNTHNFCWLTSLRGQQHEVETTQEPEGTIDVML